jgi:predicted nucleotidyltransferase
VPLGTDYKFDAFALDGERGSCLRSRNTVNWSMEKKKEILARISKSVQETEPQAEIVLFGSRARGEERKDSDWDILILVPYSVDLTTEQKFRHKLFELELEYGQVFSTFVYSKPEWEKKHHVTPFYKNIEKEGIWI